MTNKKTLTNLLFQKFTNKAERISKEITVQSEKLINKDAKLDILLEKFAIGSIEINIPSYDSRLKSWKKWKTFLLAEDVIFSKEDLYNLIFEFEVISDIKFWNLLSIKTLSEIHILAIVRMLHYYWTDIDILNDIVEKFKSLLLNYNSTKKIIEQWKLNPKFILGSEEKSLEKILLENIKFHYKNINTIYKNPYLDIKKNDLIANLIQYEYVIYLLGLSANSQEILNDAFTQFSKFFLHSARPKFSENDTRKISKTLVYKRNDLLALFIIKINNLQIKEVKEFYKNSIINLLLENPEYGDPRITNWHNFENKEALAIFTFWMNEKDIKFFFECLIEDNADIHDRKGFWTSYANHIIESKFLIGNLLCNETYQEEINKLKKMYKNIFLDIGSNNKFFNTNVFILRIKNFIFVEFSSYSNACYVYDYQYYIDKIQPLFATSNNRKKLRIKDLKQKEFAIAKFRHTSKWQELIRFFIEHNI